MSTDDLTPAQKQKQFRADQQAKGLRAKQLWMPEDRIPEVEAFVKQLLAEHEDVEQTIKGNVEFQTLRSQMVRKAIALVDATLKGYGEIFGSESAAAEEMETHAQEEAENQAASVFDEPEAETDDLDDMI